MEKKDCSFFHEPWEATVGRSPYNSLALPHRGYRLHTSCALNNDVPERQWLKESMCDTRSSSSKLQQQVTGEKWGQKKQVSAGNERKEGGKNAQDYRQKNKRGGGWKFHTDVPKAAVGVSCPGRDTRRSPPGICTSPGQTQKQMAVACTTA